MNKLLKPLLITSIALAFTACGQVSNPDTNSAIESEAPTLSNVPEPLTNAKAMSARDFYEKAFEIAKEKADDVKLVRMDSQRGMDFNAHVPADGKVPHWLYTFDSESTGTQYNISVSTRDSELFNESPQNFNPDAVIPDDWIDSTEAFEIAQAAGGNEFIKDRLNKPVYYSLIVDLQTGIPVWQVRYSTNPNEGIYTVVINSSTKEVLNIDEKEPAMQIENKAD